MRGLVVVATCGMAGVVLAGVVPAPAASRAAPDRRMDSYFSVWASNASVTLPVVERFYARRVDYYGRSMTREAVYRDKLGYVAQWPRRRYDVVPGSVGKSCDAAEVRCRLTTVLRWWKADAAGRHASWGANTVTLDLVRQDGALKIARESGTPVVSASCSAAGVQGCAGFR